MHPSEVLGDLLVLDLTRNLAGPYCTMFLGDLGAQVIKVESPGTGDDTRHWRPPEWAGESATFLASNRNKRSIAIDLDAEEGQEIVRRLARKADVVVSSFRPESLQKRQLDYESLRALNSALIYCSISAYGSRGPKRDWPGYDPVLQAESGLMSLTGYPDGPPARLGIGAIDLGTALWAALGIQAALRGREQTGEGSLVEVSLFETSAWWLSYHIAGLLGSGVVPSRQGSEASFLAPYEVFATAEGQLMVTAGNDHLFRQLCLALKLADLAEDPDYGTNDLRVDNRLELHQRLEERFVERSAFEWQSRLRQFGVPSSPVATVADFVQSPQFEALGLLESVPHTQVHELKLIGSPMTFNRERPSTSMPPPLLGEHSEEVLSELGYEAGDIEQMRIHGIIE